MRILFSLKHALSHTKNLSFKHCYHPSVHSESHERETGGVVTFILLSDVLIGLHIVLLLCQPLTWVTHGHGHV